MDPTKHRLDDEFQKKARNAMGFSSRTKARVVRTRAKRKQRPQSEAKRRSSEAGGSEELHRLTGVLTARTGKRLQSSIGLHPVDGGLTKSSR